MALALVTIDTRDGRCDASVFLPSNGAGPWPGVIVYVDGPGIRPALFEMGERIAAHGYVVLLPDLFYRAGPYVAPDLAKLFSDPATRSAWASKMGSASQANVMADTAAFLAFLGAHADVKQPKVGTTRYCMGRGPSPAAAGFLLGPGASAASLHWLAL